MITQNEISSLNLSPTKKDFVQIWNELIEVASKITERWDPTSTNESDPGIVLLKVLAGIADKLNYNIDKNILEAYMPTAAQMESMRKLCELVGYDIKYYQSAETRVRITYTGNTTDTSADNKERLPEPVGLALPKFTTITNADKDITFVTTNPLPKLFTNDKPWVEVPCIEGQISQCESINDSNLIKLSQLDDNNRYYLPEIQIAENGIFVYNATASLIDGDEWEQVSNLNTWPAGNRVYKFGYDSIEGRPYLVFPDDVGNLIGDGLFIYYVRTSGLSGNISHHTLEVLEIPSGDDWEDYSAEQFEVVNYDSTSNGANIESISSAYNNFKKTVGTFDTLVTCRDYMNKIYLLMDASNSPYVSNILVTDIRNDINNAITLCSCNEFGILYKETPLTKTVPEFLSRTVKEEDDGNGNIVNKLFIEQNAEAEEPLLDHFDLILYPFKTFNQVSPGVANLVDPYNRSFTYTEQMNMEIEAALADFKTCAHKITQPVEGDVVAINNYLRLNASIATSAGVTEMEAEAILHNVKVALVNEFNLRKLDFGEEIPFDSILSVIENADPRIRVVSLQEPALLTTYSVKEWSEDEGITSKEYGIASSSDEYIKNSEGTIDVRYGDQETAKGETARDIYNKLALRNILAGRASLFDYNETFISNNSEKPYTVTRKVSLDLYNEQDLAQITAGILIDETGKMIPGEYIVNISNKESTPDMLPEPDASSDSIIILKVLEDEDRTIEAYETFEPYKDNTVVDDIAQVEAVCEISSTEKNAKGGVFSNITLAKNEVIKFRAPNLITTKTFPAYVYYRFERGDGSTSSGTTDSASAITSASGTGRYAEVMSLAAFINKIDSIESDEYGNTPEKFFTDLWNRLDPNLDISDEEKLEGNLGTLTASYSDGFALDSDIELATILNESIAIGTDLILADKPKITLVFANPTDVEDYVKSIFTLLAEDTEEPPTDANIKEARDWLEGAEEAEGAGDKGYLARFINKDNVKDYLDDYLKALKEALKENPFKVDFKYYRLVEGTLPVWGAYIKDCYETKFGSELAIPPEGTILWRLSSTRSHSKGKLVTETHQRLYAQTGDFLANGYISDTTFICTNLGEDPVFSSIADGSDVELRPGDKLYIHYTPSSTNEDGETVSAEPVSIVYEGGDKEDPVIIRPSGFTLMPSEDVNRQGTSWKKTNVEFVGHGNKNLLSLAPNEQIELRSISKVVIDTPARLYKNFYNTELELGNADKVLTYELKDGEYLFYTDQNTQEAAYYGSGSVITLDKGAYIPKAKEIIEVSQILQHGLGIVPWSSEVLLSKNKKITITEYQYRTLVEGDKLNTLTVDASISRKNEDGEEANEDVDTVETYYISSAEEIKIKNSSGEIKRIPHKPWTKCVSTEPIIYTPASSETSIKLPEITLNADTEDTDASTSWEVCSFLELSTSPGQSQPLRATEVVKEYDNGEISVTSVTNKLTVHTNTGTGTRQEIDIIPQKTAITDGFETVSFKLNTLVKTASGNFKKSSKDDSKEESESDRETFKLQMKVFKEEAPVFFELDSLDAAITPISSTNTTPATSDNINNYWSAIDLKEDLVASEDNRYKPRALNLNFLIPNSDTFGIFSIYLATPQDRLDGKSKQGMLISNSRVFIEIPEEFVDDADDSVISIFNYEKTIDNNTYHWWSESYGFDSKNTNRRYLRAGLNCIKVTKSCSLLIKAEDNAKGTLVYDNLRLVNGVNKHGINLDLIDFKDTVTTDSTVAEDEVTKEKRLADAVLSKIADLDKKYEFYYNAPIENSLAIAFDKSIKSLSNPYTLYDVNNINNNFVVSKLDVKYLDEGLTIARSSRSSRYLRG